MSDGYDAPLFQQMKVKEQPVQDLADISINRNVQVEVRKCVT